MSDLVRTQIVGFLTKTLINPKFKAESSTGTDVSQFPHLQLLLKTVCLCQVSFQFLLTIMFFTYIALQTPWYLNLVTDIRDIIYMDHRFGK